MRKNILLTLILLFRVVILSAQNIVIEYVVKENKNSVIISTETRYTLVIKGNESIYYNLQSDKSQFVHQQNATDIKSKDRTLVKFDDAIYGEIKNEILYKDYLKDSMIFNELMVNKKVIVAEPINIFKWTIVPKADSVILGYNCHRATCSFRGRKYEAYFSSSLNSFGGPWKFDGLPGIILVVRSTDNYYILNPIKVIINAKAYNTVNPYKNEREIMTWNGFVASFEKKLHHVLKLMKSKDPDGNGSIKITDRIEDLGIKELTF